MQFELVSCLLPVYEVVCLAWGHLTLTDRPYGAMPFFSLLTFNSLPLNCNKMRDGNAIDNVTLKYVTFISFVLLPNYFNSFNFYTNDELHRSQIGWSGVQVKKEDEKFTVLCSRSPQDLEFGNFTLFCRERQRNLPQFKTPVQSDCFCSL